MAFSHNSITSDARVYYEKHLDAMAEQFLQWRRDGATRSEMGLKKCFDLFWSMRMHPRTSAFTTDKDSRLYRADLFTTIEAHEQSRKAGLAAELFPDG